MHPRPEHSDPSIGLDSTGEQGRGQPGPTRRDLLSLAGWTSLAASSWVALRLGLRFLIPPFSYGLPSLVRAGNPSDFPLGSRRLLQRDRILIVHDPAGFRALSAVCTHLGCTVTLMEWGFNCPCHGSKFDWDGINFAGPAPRPLDCFAMGVSPDGVLVVDTRQTVPRDHYFSPPPAEPEA